MINIKKLDSKDYYKLLSEVHRDISKSSTLKEALFNLVSLTTKIIHCERGSIFLNDERTGELYSYIAQGNLEHEIRILNNSGLAGWTFTNQEAVITNNAYNDSRYNRLVDEITGFKTKSVLCVPLRSVTNELIGVTQMLNKIDGDFNENDLNIVKSLTEHAAVAIQSKLTLLAVERAHEKELRFLEAISRVSTEIQLPSLLEKIINTVTRALNAERATLFINDFKTNELYTEASIGLETKEIRFPNHLGIAGAVFTSGEVINIPHAYADLRFNPSFDKSTGFFTRSILTAPVKNKQGTIIGVTQVLNKIHGEFNNDDTSQLLAINSQISMAIENAKLFDDVQNIKNYNESILESMTNGVLTINSDGQIVTCNKSILKIFNIKSEDIISHDAILFLEKYSPILSEKIRHIRSDVKFNNQEIIYALELNTDDRVTTANVTIVPLYDNKQNSIGLMIMIENISNEKRMKSMMSRYMSSDLTEKLLSSPDQMLSGVSKTATILFSDIRNFTNITETIGPVQTVEMLNEYFTLMVDCIQKEGGILDKFIGDAIMAVFGNPFPHDDDPDRAMHAAIAMMYALNEFNIKRAKNKLPPISHGIGINTDIVVSGNIGSDKRMDFTVIGDGVNLASRIESLCKEYGAEILISENTFRSLKSTYRTRQLDRVVVKGKVKPITIYEVINHFDKTRFPNQIEVLTHFANGMDYYLGQQWAKGIESFQKALHLHPNDKPSQIYLQRCQELSSKPFDPDWNGVWIMDHK